MADTIVKVQDLKVGDNFAFPTTEFDLIPDYNLDDPRQRRYEIATVTTILAVPNLLVDVDFICGHTTREDDWQWQRYAWDYEIRLITD